VLQCVRLGALIPAHTCVRTRWRAYVGAYIYVCESVRGRDGECVYACACACMSERKREKERERETERVRERECVCSVP